MQSDSDNGKPATFDPATYFPREGDSIYGPYRHRGQFRLVVRRANPAPHEPAQFYLYEATEERARKRKLKCLAKAESVTVTDAIDRFCAYKRDELGRKATTVATARFKLRAIYAGCLGAPIDEIGESKARALFAALVKRTKAVDTRINTLAEAKTFSTWCVEHGLIKASPWLAVAEKGERKTGGKPQLRVDEARTLVAFAFAVLDRAKGDLDQIEPAVAVLMAATLGMRATEIVTREVRDLDDRGRTLVIDANATLPDGVKTYGSRRTLALPVEMREALALLAKGKRSTDRLFPDRTRFWLDYHVHRLCDDAGVPLVCAHGLRATCATLATEAGAASEAVFRALGNTLTVLRRHYVKAGAEDGARARSAMARAMDRGNGKRARRAA